MGSPHVYLVYLNMKYWLILIRWLRRETTKPSNLIPGQICGYVVSYFLMLCSTSFKNSALLIIWHPFTRLISTVLHLNIRHENNNIARVSPNFLLPYIAYTHDNLCRIIRDYFPGKGCRIIRRAEFLEEVR